MRRGVKVILALCVVLAFTGTIASDYLVEEVSRRWLKKVESQLPSFGSHRPRIGF